MRGELMKTMITTFLLLLFVNQAGAMPKAFEIEYVNYAWGYNAYGCIIDWNRYIYQYKFGHSSTNEPILQIGQVSDADFQLARNLAESAANGTYSEKRVMADAGTVTWKATLPYGQEVSLKAKGDMYGTNTSPDSVKLAELMDQWCKLPEWPFPNM